MSVAENLHIIQEKINASCLKAGRKASEVEVIAVTKYVNTQKAKEAVSAGIRHIGENRPEGLIEKYEALKEDGVSFHFIGTLQSRKVKMVLPYADYIHSLDRLSLAKEIEKRAEQPVKCFVQVNVSGEATKHGLSMVETVPFIESLQTFSKIQVVGLMTMAPQTNDESLLRSVFENLKNYSVTLRPKVGPMPRVMNCQWGCPGIIP